MYDYRSMTPEERRDVIRERHARGFPLHAPPHFRGVTGDFLITAACFEHRPVFAQPADLSWLLNRTVNTFIEAEVPCRAWVFLPNHYHVVLHTEDVGIISEILRLLHSRVATEINGRHHRRGRRVWYRFSDRLIRSERHHWATVNYLHYNPVKHGYVDQMTAWPWSSIHEYLADRGEDEVLRMWRDYPVGDYGRGWDW